MRLKDAEGHHYITVDGTDFQIQEPGTDDDVEGFDSKWYSIKFKAAGVRYEVGVSLYNSSIAWLKGPFPCGEYPDDKIFGLFLSNKLKKKEKVIADKGYRSFPLQCTCPKVEDSQRKKKIMSRARNRQETVNKRFKQYGVLRKIFRHHRSKHKACFYAVAVVTQLTIVEDEPLMKTTPF